MFQLRFLIGSPRRQSPHIFSHRDYRGQRTQQDDFHPQFNTYVCAPKGNPGTPGSKTSYDVMIELMEHSAQNQPASHLFPIIEVWNPKTRERLKLAGDEIILRPSDLAAAQEAFDATKPVPIGNAIGTTPTNEQPNAVNTEPVNDVNPVNPLHLGAILDALEANPDTQITLGSKELGNELPSDFVNKALSFHGAAHPTLPDKTIHVDVLTHEGRAIVLGMALKPVSLGKVVAKSPDLPPTTETENSKPKTENPAPSVLDRVRTEIQTNGKATATTLANTLGISADAIKKAVASEGSGLQNKGGWISLIPTEN